MESSKVRPSSPVSKALKMESCVDLIDHHKTADMSSPAKRFQMGNRKMKDEKMYPPPIPLLVRSENVSCSYMKRHYTGDGRLILTEEKVRQREFLRAQRSDGRLRLQIVAVEEEEHVAEERRNVRVRDAAFMLGVAVPASGTLRAVPG